MRKPEKPSLSKILRLLRNPGFWIILLLFVIISIFHYSNNLGTFLRLGELMTDIGLTRHAFERILFLVPLVWSGFLFGVRGTIVATIIALVCMIPRIIFISEYPIDSLLETVAVVIVGCFVSGMSAFSLKLVKRERQYLLAVEKAHRELFVSGERYRSIFENAHDAIWLQDMDGNVMAANEASSKMTGYGLSDLIGMNVRAFLPEASLEVARNVRQKLLQGEPIEHSYDQRFVRKDGTEVFLRLSTSLVLENGRPSAFQHIARDTTEEKRMQENLEFYLKEATEAQEEERKRISRELHDETIQEMVVLSQRLDMLSSKSRDLSERDRSEIEKLYQDTVEIIRGVRRLSQDLRPAALDRLGLTAALEWLISDIKEYTSIEIEITVTGEKRRLSEQEELILFRITQEALRNAWRHSEATKIAVNVEFTPETIRIIVSDNGKGFNPPKSMGDLAKDGKLGLAGMQERARLIGGVMSLKSVPGEGTEIMVELRKEKQDS